MLQFLIYSTPTFFIFAAQNSLKEVETVGKSNILHVEGFFSRAKAGRFSLLLIFASPW